ncbi:MAG: rhamnulokinase [Bacteroidales bacterium]|nr:rhamnulokinase [Bacteroidales bacterium]
MTKEAKYYLAFDLGASSGRAILGEVSSDKINITEIHRFPNNFIKINGHYYWNIYTLFEELQKGIKILKKQFDVKLESIGIDTWGVDFGLLDKSGNILNLPLSYRDHITDGIIDDFTKNIMPASDLYAITGIQFLKFNSLFQLYALSKHNRAVLENADKLLFIPDLLNYLFTGVKATEYSIASTSQLLDARTKNWSDKLLKTTGINKDLFTGIVQPGTKIGELRKDIADEIQTDTIPVIAVAGHDTGSAIVSVPAKGDNWAYLSSGTWSLMGIEINQPILSAKALQYGFTNEGGIDGTIRFLKNISGMWILEQCKKQWDKEKNYTYNELVEAAKQAEPFKSFINTDSPEFSNPQDMIYEIQEFCKRTKQISPETTGQITRVIFESLAMKYKFTMEQLKELAPKPINTLHIIGGGCQNELLCQFTANALGMTVIAGPAEATAIGNIMVQAIACKQINTLSEIRNLLSLSFNPVKYSSQQIEEWNKAYPLFVKISSK